MDQLNRPHHRGYPEQPGAPVPLHQTINVYVQNAPTAEEIANLIREGDRLAGRRIP